jgi:putative FmdB family regulatory protein
LPLYPYRCTQCGHRFEKIQHFSDEPEKVCPKCGGALERPLTAPGLQFKGAGWYVNDYAPKSSSSGDDAAPSEKKSETKAEKPEAKVETKLETKSPSGAETSAASPAPSTPTKSASDTPASSSS